MRRPELRENDKEQAVFEFLQSNPGFIMRCMEECGEDEKKEEAIKNKMKRERLYGSIGGRGKRMRELIEAYDTPNN